MTVHDTLLLLVLAFPLAPSSRPVASCTPFQDDAELRSTVDRLLEAARTGSPVVRPQAARRLLRLGAPAAALLGERCAADPARLAELGPELVEVLGQFGDAPLRALLWASVHDVDFPWRPAAARSLCTTAQATEGDALEVLLEDPLAAVRVAAVDGLRTLERREAMGALQDRLADPDDRVRRAAAALLATWGEPWALSWLLEDLLRTDRFFDLPQGRAARYASIRLLRQHLGDDFGFAPGDPPDTDGNRAAVAALRGRIAERVGQAPPRPLPPQARAGHATDGDVIGLEIRSCRRGEFFLRWNLDDVLHVGTGNAAAVMLAPGTVEGLLEQVGARVASLGDDRLWGTPGCDSEVFYWCPRGADTLSLRVLKGPQPAGRLRPETLSEVARLLLATVPAGLDLASEDPRLVQLSVRLREALAAVGGDLDGAEEDG